MRLLVLILVLHAALTLSPFSAHARYIQNVEATARSFTRNSVTAPDSGDCRRLIESRQYDQAILCYEGELREHPSALAPRLGKAEALRLQKKYDQAIHEYDLIIDADTTAEEAYFGRARANAALQDHQKAIDDFSAALRLDPANNELYVLRGSEFSILGDEDAALRDLEKGTERETKNARALAQAGLAHGLARRVDASMKDFSRCFAIDSTEWLPFLYRGIVRFLDGRYREASRDFRNAAGLGNSAEARSWLYFSEFKAYGAAVAAKNLRLYRKNAEYLPPEDWGEIVQFLLAEVTEDQLIADISKSWERNGTPLTKERIAEASSDTYFAIGMAGYITGLKVGPAKYWKKCLDTNAKGFTSYSLARALTEGAWKK